MLLPGDVAELSGVNLRDLMQGTDWHCEVLWAQFGAGGGPFIQQTQAMFLGPKRAPSPVETCGGFKTCPLPQFVDSPIKRRVCAPLDSGLSAGLTTDYGRRLFSFCSETTGSWAQALRNKQFPRPVSWDTHSQNPATPPWRSLNGPVERPRHHQPAPAP